jgi:hypothetical protein
LENCLLILLLLGNLALLLLGCADQRSAQPSKEAKHLQIQDEQ